MDAAGYDNAACYGKDGASSIQMDRVTAERAKCCGGGPRAQVHRPPPSSSDHPSTATVASANVCAAKCPAVQSSPWDPLKTWFAAVLSVAIVVWVLSGVYAVKFQHV